MVVPKAMGVGQLKEALMAAPQLQELRLPTQVSCTGYCVLDILNELILEDLFMVSVVLILLLGRYPREYEGGH